MTGNPNILAAGPLASGPEIVETFLQSLTADSSLDLELVAAIVGLAAEDKLSFTNLLKKLSDLRGGIKP